MKGIHLLILVFVFSVFSCKNKQGEISETEQAIMDSLIAEAEAANKKAVIAEQSLNDFMDAFNDINQNLEEIKRKEDIIDLNTQNMELGQVGADKIQENIMSIYELLQENKQTVSSLRNKLETSNMVSSRMQESLDLLALSIERKNQEIIKLRERLKNISVELKYLNQNIDSLLLTNQQQSELLKEQEDILNTGYYIIGTTKELFDLGIITKEGGLVGLGSVSQIDEHFDNSLFKTLKIHSTKKISLNCRKARLLSTHPANAYKFDGPDKQINHLIITRPEKFWATSRYLVVEVVY
jgi:hypothetical protein